MLIVAAEVMVNRADIERLRHALRAMEEASRREPGCSTYAFSIDLNEPTTLRAFEVWQSPAALAAHFQTPHMAAFREALRGVAPPSIKVKAYEIEKEVPLPR